MEWNHTLYQSGGEFVQDLAVTEDGGYCLVGGIVPPYDTIEGGDAWVVKTDSSGQIEWNQAYGGSRSDEAHAVHQTSDQGFIVVGDTKSYGPPRSMDKSGNLDIWLFKLSSNGEVQWNQFFGGSNIERAFSMDSTSDGGYILAGITQSYGAGGLDFWVVKTDAMGGLKWTLPFGGGQDDVAYDIHQTLDGGYIIIGSTKSFGSGNEDFFVVKLHPESTPTISTTSHVNEFDVCGVGFQLSTILFLISGLALNKKKGRLKRFFID
jgi:hypothetical protein